jgi:hypothetical protein
MRQFGGNVGKSCGLRSEVDSERDVAASHAITPPTTLMTATTAVQPRTWRSVAKKDVAAPPIAINSSAAAMERRAFGFPRRLFKRSALTLLGRRVGSGILQRKMKGDVYRPFSQLDLAPNRVGRVGVIARRERLERLFYTELQ